MKKLKHISFALVFFGGFLVFSHVYASSDFGLRPAYPRADNNRTESIFIHTLEPGSVQNEGVKVINNSTTEEKTFIVYASDSTPSSGGQFACEQLSEDKDGVGSWIDFDISSFGGDPTVFVQSGEKNAPLQISVPAGQQKIVPFTITVPKDASVGEHNGCVLIQEVNPEEKRLEKVGATISIRSGIRVAISVPGDIIRKLEIVGYDVIARKDSFLLRPIVKNTGNVSLDVDLKVYTMNIFGKVIEEHGGEFPVLRDQLTDWNFELKKPFWGGLYKTNYQISYDGDLNATVGANTGGDLTVVESATKYFFSFPRVIALIVELVVLLLIIYALFIWRISAKRKKWIKKSWVSYTVHQGESLVELSSRLGLSWKVLAKVNKIKAPYMLQAGQTLLVPPPRKNTENNTHN